MKRRDPGHTRLWKILVKLFAKVVQMICDHLNTHERHIMKRRDPGHTRSFHFLDAGTIPLHHLTIEITVFHRVAGRSDTSLKTETFDKFGSRECLDLVHAILAKARVWVWRSNSTVVVLDR